MANRRLEQVLQSPQFHLDDRGKIGVRQLRQVIVPQYACPVDQDTDPSELAGDHVDHLPGRRGAGHIAAEICYQTTCLLQLTHERIVFSRPAQQYDPATHRRQSNGPCLQNPRGAGDYHHIVSIKRRFRRRRRH